MITITYKGKTYEPAKYESKIVEREVKRMITLCELEEVKENKELPMRSTTVQKIYEEIDRKIEEITEEKSQYEFFRLSGYRYISNFIDKLEKEPEGWTLVEKDKLTELIRLANKSDTSILEKLRSELETRKKKMIEENWGPSYIEQVVWTLAVLDSLETPQFTPGQEEPEYNEEFADEMIRRTNDPENTITGTFDNSKDLIDHLHKVSWTPTPGQMIEVSNDGEKWEKRIFRKLEDNEYIASEDTSMKYLKSFKFARPIKIEPELPEFSYDRCDEENNLVEQVHEIGVQVEALTTFCQALARQKTTK